MLLIDLIAIWRAWALFQDQRWVIVLPFILWIGAVGDHDHDGRFPEVVPLC